VKYQTQYKDDSLECHIFSLSLSRHKGAKPADLLKTKLANESSIQIMPITAIGFKCLRHSIWG